MIGLDTNVVVRHLVDDDPVQSPVAHACFDGLSRHEPGFISIVTLAEVHWVLRQSYRFSREQVHQVIARLLSASDLVIGDADTARRALAAADDAGCDFPDALIAQLGAAGGCRETVTFDRKAAVLPAVRLLV